MYRKLVDNLRRFAHIAAKSGKRCFTFEQCKRIALAPDTGMDYLAGLTDEKKCCPRSGSAT